MRTLLVLVLAGLVVGAASATGLPPSIRITAMSPVTVAGRHFHPHARVRVTLRSDVVTRTRIATTNATGGFTIVLVTIPGGDPCSMSLEIVAVDAAGNRAVVKSVPRECPPATP